MDYPTLNLDDNALLNFTNAKYESIMNANCKLGITYVIGLNCTEDLYINVNELHVSRNHLQITFRNDVLELRL